MKDVNRVILVGRLGADPVQRETKSGVPVAHFPLATSRKTREGDEEGQSAEETQWHRIVAWGKQAEICGQYLRKGQPVYIEGSIRSRKYDAKDGIQRTAFEVHADNVSFLGFGNSAKPESSDSMKAAS